MRRRGDWNHYTYVYGESARARVDFDVEAALLPQRGGVSVRVMGPEGLDLSLLEPLDALLVGTLRYAGKVEALLHQEAGDVDPAVRAALEAAGATVEVHPGWDVFDDRICPSPADWRRIEDRETLERLDLDGDQRLRVLHRFVGAERGLEPLQAQLIQGGMELVERRGEHLVMAHVHPIGEISAVTVALLTAGEKLGVAYDGWVLPG